MNNTRQNDDRLLDRALLRLAELEAKESKTAVPPSNTMRRRIIREVDRERGLDDPEEPIMSLRNIRGKKRSEYEQALAGEGRYKKWREELMKDASQYHREKDQEKKLKQQKDLGSYMYHSDSMRRRSVDDDVSESAIPLQMLSRAELAAQQKRYEVSESKEPEEAPREPKQVSRFTFPKITRTNRRSNTFDAAYAVEREKQRQRRSPPPTQKARRIKMTRKREPNKPDPVIYPGVPVSVPSRSPAVVGRERASARAPLELEKGRPLSDEERRLAREALESDRLAADIDLAERIRAAELRKSKRQQTKKDIKILDTASKIDVSAVSRGRTRGVKGPSHVAKGLPPISPSMGSASTSQMQQRLILQNKAAALGMKPAMIRVAELGYFSYRMKDDKLHPKKRRIKRGNRVDMKQTFGVIVSDPLVSVETTYKQDQKGKKSKKKVGTTKEIPTFRLGMKMYNKDKRLDDQILNAFKNTNDNASAADIARQEKLRQRFLKEHSYDGGYAEYRPGLGAAVSAVPFVSAYKKIENLKDAIDLWSLRAADQKKKSMGDKAKEFASLKKQVNKELNTEPVKDIVCSLRARWKKRGKIRSTFDELGWLSDDATYTDGGEVRKVVEGQILLIPRMKKNGKPNKIQGAGELIEVTRITTRKGKAKIRGRFVTLNMEPKKIKTASGRVLEAAQLKPADNFKAVRRHQETITGDAIDNISDNQTVSHSLLSRAGRMERLGGTRNLLMREVKNTTIPSEHRDEIDDLVETINFYGTRDLSNPQYYSEFRMKMTGDTFRHAAPNDEDGSDLVLPNWNGNEEERKAAERLLNEYMAALQELALKLEDIKQQRAHGKMKVAKVSRVFDADAAADDGEHKEPDSVRSPARHRRPRVREGCGAGGCSVVTAPMMYIHSDYMSPDVSDYPDYGADSAYQGDGPAYCPDTPGYCPNSPVYNVDSGEEKMEDLAI